MSNVTFDQRILQRIKLEAGCIAERIEDKDGKLGCYAYSGDWNKRDAALLHKLTVLWVKYQGGEVSEQEALDAYWKLIK